MADDNRLIEIMAELLAEVRDIKVELRGFKSQSDSRLGRLEEQMVKNNLAIGELRLSVMNLADRIEQLMRLDQRVKVLENMMLPSEPR